MRSSIVPRTPYERLRRMSLPNPIFPHWLVAGVSLVIGGGGQPEAAAEQPMG
jgi:hypothetical protein